MPHEVADRVVYMAEGVIVAEGAPEEVFEDARVKAFARSEEYRGERAFFWLAPRYSLREARVAGGNLRIARP